MMGPDNNWLQLMLDLTPAECGLTRLRHRADNAFMVNMGARIIQMQSGFAMLESAYVQPNGSANIMMKNMMDLFVGAVAYLFCGYWISHGETHMTAFLGGDLDFSQWFCSFSYATTSATIDSGALAGRIAFWAYVVLSTVMTGITYPLAARWSWGNGWLQQLGFVDFAGSAVVHMLGAVSALVGACFCGPRIGRFPSYRCWRGLGKWLFREKNSSEYYQIPKEPSEKNLFRPFVRCRHPVQLLFGTWLLLVGFLAFNPASTLAVTEDADLVVGRASVCTLLAAAGGGLGGMLWSMAITRSTVVLVPEVSNAVIAALVASCACCNAINPVVAMFVGFVGAILALACDALLVRLQIDDPVGAVAAHGPPGVWGTVAVAFFAEPNCQSDVQGLLYGASTAGWQLLAVQILGVVALSAMSAGVTYITLLFIDIIMGVRCSRACELIGLDFWEHQFDDGSVAGDNPIKRMSTLRKTFQRASSCCCYCGSAPDAEQDALGQPASAPHPAATKPSNLENLSHAELSMKIQSLEVKLERLMTAMLQDGSTSQDIFGGESSHSQSFRAACINAYVDKMTETPPAM
ncbi:unnamed protein product [Symbiodinium pilosum]|uniref:Ammonium transporter AmtB-like domain-containing protein n=1 Tax=Symbiodinium pilosum TaxID=2952 RepID=A0A812S466_SYMPI|nr:unnamed protein product [Symbiodinium pilosum]